MFIYWACPHCRIVEITSYEVATVTHEHGIMLFHLMGHKTKIAAKNCFGHWKKKSTKSEGKYEVDSRRLQPD